MVYYSPSSGYVNEVVTFSFSFINNVGATIQLYDFYVAYSYGPGRDFGPTVVAPYGSATFFDSETLPSTAGDEWIEFSAYGLASTDSFPIFCSFVRASLTVLDRPALAVTAQAQPTSGTVPLDVTFTGSASGGSPPYSFFWDFGDGENSSSASPSHTYQTPGTFTASLTVMDSVESQRTASVVITATAPPLEFAVTADPASGVVPLSVAFVCMVSSGSPPYAYAWVFGDGGTATDANPTHTYTSPGSYDATVTVTDSFGTQSTRTIPIVVVSPLASTASADRTEGTAPMTSTFTSDATGGTPPYSILWDFGDGSNGTGVGTTHVFEAAGTYTVMLTITDAEGRSVTKTIEITVRQPSATGPAGGFDAWLVYGVAIAIAAAAVVAVVVWRIRRSRAPPSG